MSELDSENENNNEEYEPKIVSKEINLAGDRDNCNVCKESDEFFSSKAPEVGTTYNYSNMESEEGKRIRANIEPDKSGDIPIPVIEYCKTIQEDKDSEPKKVCDYLTGFNKNEWDSNLNYKKRNEVDDEIDEIFGDD